MRELLWLASAHTASSRGLRLALVATCVAVCSAIGLSAQRRESSNGHGVPGLAPTAHPPVPNALRDLWLVPASLSDAAQGPATATANLARAARLISAGQHRDAVLLIDADGLASTPLGPHARYLLATSLAALNRHEEALALFLVLGAANPEGALSREWRRGAAMSAEVIGEHAVAATHYEALVSDKSTLSPEALDGWGRTLTVMGDRERAVAAFMRLYYEFPASELAGHARRQAEALAALTGQSLTRSFAEDLARAERLVALRAYGDARLAFERLVSTAAPDDRDLVELRLASVNLAQKRFARVVELAAPHRSTGDRQDEAGYLWAMAVRRLGRAAEFVTEAQRLAKEFPESPWSARALDELATHHVLQDRDDAAMDVFREIIDQFPDAPAAERASWRYGWAQYRSGQHAVAAQAFERGAAAFPRSDFRPAYLYWAGRAHAQLGGVTEARARLSVAVQDYGNSYYGRLAADWLQRLETPAADATGAPRDAQLPITPLPSTGVSTSGGVPPGGTTGIPTDTLVRQLLALELYDAALLELDFAKTKWGPSATLDATIAWIHHRNGDLRRGINVMKRAYPQYMSEAGHTLPMEVQRVLFPLRYWDLIKQHASNRGLDPFLVAALVAQESTFQADVKSSANAYGLMQIIPSTGRRLARLEGLKSFTTRSLINPEINVRLGTSYFARLLDRFEHPHLALAGYNAGDSRVVRWTAQRAALPADEFVEDIPFPETQNYVKRILGTASDYRRLYGELGAAPTALAASAPPALAPSASAASTPVAASPAAAPKRPAGPKKATAPSRPKSQPKSPTSGASTKPRASQPKKPASTPAAR